MQKNRFSEYWILQLSGFLFLSVILFLPVLHKAFVSDDYEVINRVCLNGTFKIDGFFRPMSDFAIYFNYLIGGLDPTGYNLFNILLHGVNSFLLFRFLLFWGLREGINNYFSIAILSGLLFVVYPFHSECIDWMLGRASLIGSFFGILALVTVVSGVPELVKIILVCLFFFTGLASYESIFPLPVIILFFLPRSAKPFKYYSIWLGCLVLTLIIHFWVRISFSGSVAGNYGQGFLVVRIFHYLVNIGKTGGRLLVPPIENSKYFLAVAGAALVVLIIACRYFLKTGRELFYKNKLTIFIIALVMSCAIPVFVGLSTKTSESDRLLYFPSFFLCSILSFLLLKIFQSKFQRLISILLVLCYFILFLEITNSNWRKASSTINGIIGKLKSDSSSRRVYIANIPGEYRGAYIFREGFSEALLINGIDTTKYRAINILTREQMNALPVLVSADTVGGSIFIPPVVHIRKLSVGNKIVGTEKGKLELSDGDKIYYWNNQSLIELVP